MNSKSKSWVTGWPGDLLLCLATASLLWVGPLIACWKDGWRMEFSPLHLMPDSALYLGILERAAQTDLSGDPFLWEHRNDPASLWSFYHFWPKVYGWISRWMGLSALLQASFLLSALWLFAVWRLCRALGQPRSYAYFTAGFVTFFSVNIAYNVIGYRWHFESWNLWLTEHLRLYPSLTAMTVYSVAVWLAFKNLGESAWGWRILGGGMMGLTAYGRPYDWMVLLLFLGLLGGVFGLRRDWRRFGRVMLLLAITLGVSSYFIWKFLNYRSVYAWEYLDQIARGNLHAKLISHYLKYGLATGVVLGAMGWWMEMWPRRKEKGSVDDPRLFLGCLLAASLLAHFHTLKDRVTLVGFAYFFVFSMVPWGSLCVCQGLYRRWNRPGSDRFNSAGWALAMFLLIVTQQIGLGIRADAMTSRWKISDDRLKVYRWLKEKGAPGDVALGVAGSGEVAAMTGAYSFLPHPVVAAYIASAPTTELLDRFLWTKLIYTGTVADLEPLFRIEGVADLEEWKCEAKGETRRWFEFLTDSLGHNFFIFHPKRNSADLAARGMRLPSKLRSEDRFVVYFDDSMRKVFWARLQESCKRRTLDEVLQGLRARYRVDYLLIDPGMSDIKARLAECSLARLAVTTPTCELWRVLPDIQSK